MTNGELKEGLDLFQEFLDSYVDFLKGSEKAFNEVDRRIESLERDVKHLLDMTTIQSSQMEMLSKEVDRFSNTQADQQSKLRRVRNELYKGGLV